MVIARWLMCLALGCSGVEAKEPPEAPLAGEGAGGESAAAEAELDAPVEEQALLTFLAEARYADWAKEAEAHTSPIHGDGVQVFYSPKAAAAIRADAAALPAGAATVKELTSDGTLSGHAVWVKTRSESDEGRAFFWYEVLDRGGGKTSVYGNELGSPDCVGCHAAGKDYNLSTLPFE